MPLGKFWAGEYTTATERLAAAQGIPYTRSSPKAIAHRNEAYKAAKAVRQWMEQGSFLTETAWEDDGEIVFSEQFRFEAIHAVRAYATHQERSEEVFHMTTNFRESPFLKRAYTGANTDFPHLIHHEDNTGFYVPVDFPHPKKLMGQPPTIGSSLKLMMELAVLRRKLGALPTYDEWQAGTPIEAENPSLEWVKYGVIFLYHVCWLSVQHRLPIIIDG
ncbi:MAG: hypothetical protein QM796_19550 [Chthoniobacteraceae bacterium]